MELSQERIMAAFSVDDENTKKGLYTLFGKVDNRPVTERIKDVDDAIQELDEDHTFVKEYMNYGGKSGDLLAYLRLRIVVAALNEGWDPQLTDDELRFAPFFRLFTNKEIEDMDENQRKIVCRVVGRAHHNARAVGGLACACAYHASSHSYTCNGSRLALKSEELAVYAGNQFIELYRDFLIQQ